MKESKKIHSRDDLYIGKHISKHAFAKKQCFTTPSEPVSLLKGEKLFNKHKFLNVSNLE